MNIRATFENIWATFLIQHLVTLHADHRRISYLTLWEKGPLLSWSMLTGKGKAALASIELKGNVNK